MSYRKVLCSFVGLLWYIFAFSSLSIVMQQAFAHPGRTDSSGGHYNRKTGEYHYHNRTKASPKTKYRPKTYKYSVPEETIRSTPTYTKRPLPRNEVIGVKVVGYSDGDTITVLKDREQIKIRLYGIDCPEKGQAFGKKAKQAIAQILNGRDVKIKVLDYDRYGRAVALVYADGKSANRIMIQAGYAWQYRKYCKETFCDDWLVDEKEARQLGRGLWQDDSYEAPWIWRKK